MINLCEKCGHAMDFQWNVTEGVWEICPNCGFKARPVYSRMAV